MKRVLQVFGLLALLLTSAAVFGSPLAPNGRVLDLRLKHGDDPRWAAPDFDDRDWQRIAPTEIPARTGPYWLRLTIDRGLREIRIDERDLCLDLTDPRGDRIDGLFVVAVYSFDLYWDGQLLRRSGVVGSTREEERAGLLKHIIRIPDNLLEPGPHVVALRMSSHRFNFPNSKAFTLALSPINLVAFIPRMDNRAIAPLMLMAGALMIAATSVVMFLFSERRRSLLLCHVVSLALALFYGLIAVGYLTNYPYDWLAPRYITIAVISGVISVLLPWLVAEHFSVLRRGEWLIILVPLLVAAWMSGGRYEFRSLWMCRAMLLVTAGIVVVAAWHGRPGARWLWPLPLIGIPLVHSWAALFLDPSFFIFLEALVFFVFASLGMQVQAERKRARELMLTAARLETELLKRNIQPHFLLNTLATIIEMIEQTPKTAVNMIEALANEFRILARVSGEKLIPIGQEIELCRAHLNIMSLRKGARCTLVVSGVDDEALVPPALFHTLVENGLTHLMPREGEQRFELRGERLTGRRRYVMSVTGDPNGRSRGREQGTGTRYIKARLEESFPGRWSVTSESIADGWRTVIEVSDDGDRATNGASQSIHPVPLPLS